MPRKRPTVTGRSFQGNTQNLIVLLLVLLILITSVNLYLDHFAGNSKRVPVQQPVGSLQEQPKMERQELPVQNTTGTTTATMIPPVDVKPAPIETRVETEEVLPEPGKIRIQILNGCGAPGIANRLRGVLRDRGFDVLTVGNAKAQNYKKSTLIARSDPPFGELAAKAVAKSLGISEEQISVKKDPALVDTDVTLVIGADYQRLNLK
jgi:hypothetical protein